MKQNRPITDAEIEALVALREWVKAPGNMKLPRLWKLGKRLVNAQEKR